MDVIRIFNGLGNQMSQYAFYLAKKRAHPFRTCFVTNRYDCENVHNGYELGSVFGIRSSRLKENILYRFLSSHHIPFPGYRLFWHLTHEIKEASNYDYDADLMQPSRKLGFTFFWGGWHSEKYFSHLREELLRVFSFDERKLNVSCLKWAEKIRSETNTCSLHVRRGDFLKDPKWGGAIDPDYYQRAIAYVRGLHPDVCFYVFSNDIEWCRKQWGDENFHYVDCNRGSDSWQDMFLMSICRHHINANSSFSWWGAWLCCFDDTVVIVPKRFRADMITKDVYPDRWIKL